eukprot:m.336166 g.336166  ORF g.336166 m.336166 type:complete len:160 (+) comp17774_c0_seq1:163-642(+)
MSEDYELPRAVVQRLVKETLPDGLGVSKDAKIAFGVAARVFVSYCTATANDIALEDNRKTLTAKDVLKALEEMEFNEFLEPLATNLDAYKKEQERKKQRKSAAKEAKEKEEAKAKEAEAQQEAAPVEDGATPVATNNDTSATLPTDVEMKDTEETPATN